MDETEFYNYCIRRLEKSEDETDKLFSRSPLLATTNALLASASYAILAGSVPLKSPDLSDYLQIIALAIFAITILSIVISSIFLALCILTQRYEKPPKLRDLFKWRKDVQEIIKEQQQPEGLADDAMRSMMLKKIIDIADHTREQNKVRYSQFGWAARFTVGALLSNIAQLVPFVILWISRI